MALLQNVILIDVIANRPAAAAVAVGTLFHATDTLVTQRNNGTSWDDYVGPGSSLADPITFAHGGTGLTTVAQGDIIYGSSSSAWSKLAKDTNATRYLSNTGGSNNPAWAQINLANGVTGTLPATSGGSGFASYAVGDLLSADTTTTLSKVAAVATGRVLASAGTSTLPTWSVSPQVTRIGLGAAADANAALKAVGQYYSLTFDNGNSGGSKTIDWSTGNEQYLTLTGSPTLTFSNPADGGRYTLVVTTGAGSFNITWPGTVKWSGGSAPTVTATASKVDIFCFTYIASVTTFYGAFIQNF